MIYFLIITNLLTLVLLFFLRLRYQQLVSYQREADKERIALAMEVGELRDLRDFISFKSVN